jgi:hypothetical protein
VDAPTPTDPLLSVNAAWKSNISLFDRKQYRFGPISLSSLLIENPVFPSATSNLTVSCVGLDSPVELPRNLILVPPAIQSVDWGNELPGAVIKIEGMYFGNRAPKVYLELESLNGENGWYTIRSCKLARRNATGKKINYPFMDASYRKRASCMKIYADDNPDPDQVEPVGYSELYIIFPKYNMTRMRPTGYLIINNGLGISAYDYKSATRGTIPQKLPEVP